MKAALKTPRRFLVTAGDFEGRTAVERSGAPKVAGMIAVMVQHPTWPFPTATYISRALLKNQGKAESYEQLPALV